MPKLFRKAQAKPMVFERSLSNCVRNYIRRLRLGRAPRSMAHYLHRSNLVPGQLCMDVRLRPTDTTTFSEIPEWEEDE